MAFALPISASGPCRDAARWVAVAAIVLLCVADGSRAVAADAPVDAPLTDAADSRGPLDLSAAALTQHDVRMSLRVSTNGAWAHADISGRAGRALCVTLVHGDPAIARGRICAATRSRRPALSYTALASDGTPLATRRLGARVSHPAPGVLQATFLPVSAGLPVGAYGWWVQSEWSDDGDCARGCADRLPDAGAVPAQLGLLGFPPCFGAAARDPRAPCENPDLSRTVAPALSRAQLRLDPFCDKRMRPGLLSICAFGAAPEEAAGSFALVGDSHAASLKTALEVVTLGKRWRGYSILRATCPATQARPILRTRARSRQCVRWNGEVLAWLRDHREVQTVFLSAHAKAQVARGRRSGGGATMFSAVRSGYREELRALLALGRRVVVIRDVPSAARDHLRCVTAALSARRAPGAACTLRRRAAVRPDPLVAAARSVRSARVRVVDLTDQVCDARRCFAVVGGALVQHDRTHLTSPFSATLGPFILRALEE